MDYIRDFNEYYQQIDKRHAELAAELSKVDQEQDDILHFLEFDTYNAVVMMKATKRLKEVRERRREIKNEFIMVNAVHSRLGKSELTTSIQKKYTYKTAVLRGISDKKHIVAK